MSKDELYDAMRGVWRVSRKKLQEIEYVFGVYNSLIVAVYNPTNCYIYKEAQNRLPRQDAILTLRTENRLFFVDENFENGLSADENQKFYYGKSIAKLKVNQSAQNPITYLYPKMKNKS